MVVPVPPPPPRDLAAMRGIFREGRQRVWLEQEINFCP